MSDLPTRELISLPSVTMVDEADDGIILDAYVSGRLVDREAIDREALLQFLIGFHRWGEVEVDRLVDFLFGASDEK